MEEIEFKWILGEFITPDLLAELATFYSAHYGIWSKKMQSNLAGKSITLSPDKIKRDWFNNELSELYSVRIANQLVGYAVVQKGKSSNNEKIIWVTQFVIHKDYRNIGIGKKLLFAIWGFSSYYSWGLATANPYAIRALEKATRRRCEPWRIQKNSRKVLNFGNNYVSYVKGDIEKVIDNDNSKINTNFPIDHSELPLMLANVTNDETPWIMGSIEEGWEWFAFTFNDQIQIELSEEEVENMLVTSDIITMEAYGRMPMDEASQKWAKHTDAEIEYILENIHIKKDDSIIDIGCGMGRHTINLAQRGYNVIGVDAVTNLISAANEKIKDLKINAKFIVGDIYKKNIPALAIKYDFVLCLYDVIGSYADNAKNIQIIKNISDILNPGGYTIISVMNLHYTEYIAKKKFVLKKSSKELLNLAASEIMETTGNIFNPDFFLLDEETKVVYRKEVFSSGNDDRLPKELIVRDRRFYKDEIEGICKSAGLEIVSSKFVNAGWKESLDANSAKEILLICKKI